MKVNKKMGLIFCVMIFNLVSLFSMQAMLESLSLFERRDECVEQFMNFLNSDKGHEGVEHIAASMEYYFGRLRRRARKHDVFKEKELQALPFMISLFQDRRKQIWNEAVQNLIRNSLKIRINNLSAQFVDDFLELIVELRSMRLYCINKNSENALVLFLSLLVKLFSDFKDGGEDEGFFVLV